MPEAALASVAHGLPPLTETMIARVAPLTRTRAIRGTFDYRLAGDQDAVGIGTVLRIPFGGRRTTGVVVEVAERSELDPARLAEPEAVLAAAVPADLVALAGWMAGEYCSTLARALSLVLAPGSAAGVGAKHVLVADLTEDGREAIERATRLTTRQREILRRLACEGETPAAEIGTSSLRRLEARGLVTLRRGVRRRAPASASLGEALARPPVLTAEQQEALHCIVEALSSRRAAAPAAPDAPAVPSAPAVAAAAGSREPTALLLHGVTGSGKTEVYLGAVQAALGAGRAALVLVPEIALTPQALHRFTGRFGDVVAVAHSGLSPGERHDEWQRLVTGEARVCVGARSAVFAPLRDIGLIIIDEEHESSYKHEGDPRYDARTVAERRAEQHGAVLVLGTATPRPESAASRRRLRLPRRVDGLRLPEVEILDMRGRHHPLHPDTRLALGDLRRASGKAIVLLNRRGWSNFLSCRACGAARMCPQCDVALVLHRDRSVVACHHCGHREPVPVRCPRCASVAIARHGAGTEQIEHELVESLADPAFPVFRLDADSAALASRADTLQRFEAAPAGILVGTQMVAKGHDFPGIALGIVLDADATLRFPDFRAEERTFALVTQLAGRAGRRATGGRVLVQTLAPEARSIRYAAAHDADGFLAGELRRRRALGYPPYSSLIRIVCSATDAGAASAGAVAIRGRVAAPGAVVLGPAPLFRLRGRARSQVVVKGEDRKAAIAAVGAAVDELGPGLARRQVNVSVDVDPQ